jgi:hypothetical protein
MTAGSSTSSTASARRVRAIRRGKGKPERPPGWSSGKAWATSRAIANTTSAIGAGSALGARKGTTGDRPHGVPPASVARLPHPGGVASYAQSLLTGH